ncbi:MAG: CRISPR-associated helicase/endonuclease Cas3, partial [Tissierellia bacterium]|nr:CRISPR-associated helicase/endonuclease Cas3 [Tissierellia bacterium]
MQYYSHPNKLLIEHLIEVRDIGMKRLPIEMRPPYEIASLSHDFGKYTTYFQKYLINKNKSEYANHGFISAIFGAYLSL